MSQQSKAVLKFRPVLSADQITHIIHLAKRDGSRASLDVLASLVMYEYKIQNQVLAPAYAEHPKSTLIEALGFSELGAAKSHKHPDAQPIEISPEALYNLWCVGPAHLTVHQLEIVRQYRYDNNKMTVDEERAFEKEVLGIAL